MLGMQQQLKTKFLSQRISGSETCKFAKDSIPLQDQTDSALTQTIHQFVK
jgi:hypothetical protein